MKPKKHWYYRKLDKLEADHLRRIAGDRKIESVVRVPDGFHIRLRDEEKEGA